MRGEHAEELPDGRLRSPSAKRNKRPILTVLERVLPKTGLVLEIASGTGEHVVNFPQAQRAGHGLSPIDLGLVSHERPCHRASTPRPRRAQVALACAHTGCDCLHQLNPYSALGGNQGSVVRRETRSWRRRNVVPIRSLCLARQAHGAKQRGFLPCAARAKPGMGCSRSGRGYPHCGWRRIRTG